MFAIFKRIKTTEESEAKSNGKLLNGSLKNFLGFKPSNLAPYQLAISHVSKAETNFAGKKDSNERLEYLGDAVLGMIIAEHLFKKYPLKDEGFLTELRSKIVNRESLNQVALKMGVGKLLQLNGSIHKLKHSKSLYGDSLEAIIGAIYLDKGYKATQKFILQKIIAPHFDTEVLVKSMLNYKSILIEWAQKENKAAVFEIIDQNQNKHYNEFTARVLIDEQPMGTGFGYTKKKAEQDAAKRSCEALAII